jgi:hypothetical protein
MSKLPIREVREKDPLSPITKAILTLIAGLLPAMTAILGGLWIVVTYLDHQKEVQADAKSRDKLAADTRRVESQRPFLEKQLALYFETAQIAGRLIALTPDDNIWGVVEQRFWTLYWSELSMVEDEGVEKAMVDFSKKLFDYTAVRKMMKEHNQPFDEMEHKRALSGASLELAHAIRKSIESGWSGGNLYTQETTR